MSQPKNTEIVYTEGSVKDAGQTSDTIIYNPSNDTTPGIILGVQAIVGTIWWIVVSFVYVKNSNSDADIQTTTSSSSTIPLVWWWERIGVPGGYYVWHAAALMVSWIAFLLVAFTELVAWFLYIDSKYEFARYYFPTFGFWLSIFLYPIPVIFEIVHLSLRGSITFPGSWAIYHLVMSLGLWIYSALTHILYIEPFMAFIDAREPSKCVCTAPEVLEIADDATEETKLAWNFAIEQREIACDIQCPLLTIAKKCQLARLPEQSDLEYKEACQAVIDERNARARRSAAGARSAADGEEDDDAKADDTDKDETTDDGSSGWL